MPRWSVSSIVSLGKMLCMPGLTASLEMLSPGTMNGDIYRYTHMLYTCTYTYIIIVWCTCIVHDMGTCMLYEYIMYVFLVFTHAYVHSHGVFWGTHVYLF